MRRAVLFARRNVFMIQECLHQLKQWCIVVIVSIAPMTTANIEQTRLIRMVHTQKYIIVTNERTRNMGSDRRRLLPGNVCKQPTVSLVMWSTNLLWWAMPLVTMEASVWPASDPSLLYSTRDLAWEEVIR